MPASIFAPHAAVRLRSNSAGPSLVCFCAVLLLDSSQTQRWFTVVIILIIIYAVDYFKTAVSIIVF